MEMLDEILCRRIMEACCSPVEVEWLTCLLPRTSVEECHLAMASRTSRSIRTIVFVKPCSDNARAEITLAGRSNWIFLDMHLQYQNVVLAIV